MNNCCQTTGNPGQNMARACTEQAQAARREERTFQPQVDIIESAEGFTLTADIPGASADQIDVSFEDGVLTLRAPVPERQPSGTRWLVREYGVGAWERSFRVGEGIDPTRIGAVCRDGVLNLTVPKAEHARPRKIQVRAS